MQRGDGRLGKRIRRKSARGRRCGRSGAARSRNRLAARQRDRTYGRASSDVQREQEADRGMPGRHRGNSVPNSGQKSVCGYATTGSTSGCVREPRPKPSRRASPRRREQHRPAMIDRPDNEQCVTDRCGRRGSESGKTDHISRGLSMRSGQLRARGPRHGSRCRSPMSWRGGDARAVRRSRRRRRRWTCA